MTDTLLPYLSDPLTMMVMGLMTHFLVDMGRIRKEEGRFLTLRAYWVEHPHQSAICVIGAIVGLVALEAGGQLDALNAYGIGYIANSVADKIGKRSGANI